MWNERERVLTGSYHHINTTLGCLDARDAEIPTKYLWNELKNVVHKLHNHNNLKECKLLSLEEWSMSARSVSNSLSAAPLFYTKYSTKVLIIKS